ncbi:PD-(D/E)XK nuclease domain-containing protein, partial [uncultured Victivallis sp.]|uniref:PD-(D/E)XK nuclease domain-containing protein n=1 Tax=uncultured Victivallis sp. TaxID=354118 RepID=UPI0025D4213F
FIFLVNSHSKKSLFLLTMGLAGRIRIDAVCETDHWVYLFEFKLNKDDSALKQIKEKEYFKPHLLSRKRIMLIGVNFDTESGKLFGWKNEEYLQQRY